MFFHSCAPAVSGGLADRYGRNITYLRLAITDRCNLRCRYCMPRGGIDPVPHHEILSYEEMLRLVRILAASGIVKVRVTGGEPFVRRGCVDFLRALKMVPGVRSLHVTTNGVALVPHLDGLSALGLDGINLSLDTIDRGRFLHLCRRDFFPEVWDSLTGALERDIPVKINTVVQDDTPDEDIVAMAGVADRFGITVRFIEKMAFSGADGPSGASGRLRDRLAALFPAMVEMAQASPSTARLFSIPGKNGRIGLIEGRSRRFCSTCNKVRITPVGMLKACLYDNGVLDLREMLRSGASDAEIGAAVRRAVAGRAENGLVTEAECGRVREPSMASIGG